MSKCKVVSLFSGGGGLDLGFIQSGYSIVWAADHDMNAVSTYRHNIEQAITKALLDIAREDQYTVVHHECAESLEMDFVVKNTSTGKYMCVIEVKRTPASVHSTRSQYQALSYVQQYFSLMETPYFVLTNLEGLYAFRYDKSKPRVTQQILSPGFIEVASLDDIDLVNLKNPAIREVDRVWARILYGEEFEIAASEARHLLLLLTTLRNP